MFNQLGECHGKSKELIPFLLYDLQFINLLIIKSYTEQMYT